MKQATKCYTQFALYALLFTTIGCQNKESQQPSPAEDSSAKITYEANMTNNAPGQVSIDQQTRDAIADLAKRINVSIDDITVKQARAVQWPSGAMGCPKPDMNYTQALVPGLQLILEGNGTVYHYHGQTGRPLFLCPKDRVRAPAYGQGEEVM